MLRRLLSRALLLVAACMVAVALLEAGTRLAMRFTRGSGFVAEKYRSAMQEQAEASAGKARKAGPGELSIGVPEVMHPYLGYIPDPTALPNEPALGDARAIPPPSPDHLTVGVFGGSFSAGVCHWAAAELRRVLARPGKEVRLLCLGAGGYKQPQQLLQLASLLAQGAHFDLVLNIDGFNEVALPPDNISQGVAPIYPRSWYWRIGNVPDARALKLLGAVATLEEDRKAWADACLRWQCPRSALLSSVWQRFDLRWALRRSILLAEINAYKSEQLKSYAASGPTMTFSDEQALYRYLVDVWRDSSIQMQVLCSAAGIAYAHFLQPNQYVVGSKPMGPVEQRLASARGPYQKAGVIGYPLLRQQEAALRAAGVPFHDLTMIFKDVSEQMYSDGCCHLQPPGYIAVARAIGDILRTKDTPGTPAQR